MLYHYVMHSCVLRILFYLALGLVTSIAVAFACARWGQAGSLWGYGTGSNPRWEQDKKILNTAGWNEDEYEFIFHSYIGFGKEWIFTSVYPYNFDDDEPSILIISMQRQLFTGWPMLCLENSKVLVEQTIQQLSLADLAQLSIERSDIENPGNNNYSSNVKIKEKPIPLKPVWFGLIVNTLLYSLIWCLLLFIPCAIRRVRRKFKGKCLVCAYDLRGNLSNGCPECGWNRK